MTRFVIDSRILTRSAILWKTEGIYESEFYCILNWWSCEKNKPTNFQIGQKLRPWWVWRFLFFLKIKKTENTRKSHFWVFRGLIIIIIIYFFSSVISIEDKMTKNSKMFVKNLTSTPENCRVPLRGWSMEIITGNFFHDLKSWGHRE